MTTKDHDQKFQIHFHPDVISDLEKLTDNPEELKEMLDDIVKAISENPEGAGEPIDFDQLMEDEPELAETIIQRSNEMESGEVNKKIN